MICSCIAAHGLIVDTNGIGGFKELPHSMLVVGAGVTGTEYTSMLALLDIHVTLLDQKPRLLDFVDYEIAEALSYHMRDVGVTLRFGEEVESIEKTSTGKVRTTLTSGKRIVTDSLIYAVGRCGATEMLSLDKLGIKCDVKCDERLQIPVNEHFQTSLPHIYAVGDVIGFPSLASTSMEQGRQAACHAFRVPRRATVPSASSTE